MDQPHQRGGMQQAENALDRTCHDSPGASSCVVVQVVDMPLLFETGAYRLTWPTVFVTCKHDIEVPNMSSMACTHEPCIFQQVIGSGMPRKLSCDSFAD